MFSLSTRGTAKLGLDAYALEHPHKVGTGDSTLGEEKTEGQDGRQAYEMRGAQAQRDKVIRMRGTLWTVSEEGEDMGIPLRGSNPTRVLLGESAADTAGSGSLYGTSHSCDMNRNRAAGVD